VKKKMDRKEVELQPGDVMENMTWQDNTAEGSGAKVYSSEKMTLRCKQVCLPNKMLEFRNSALRLRFLNLESIHKVGILKF
jgi:hypothetical protein